MDGRARGIVGPSSRSTVKRKACGAAPPRRAGHRRVRQRVFPVHERGELERDRDLARLSAGCGSSRTPATRKSTRRASRSSGAPSVEATLTSESLRNDGRVWVPGAEEGESRCGPPPIGSPGIPSATTTSNAGTRRSAIWCRATSRREPSKLRLRRGIRRWSETGLSVYLDFSGLHRAPGQGRHQGAVREPVPDVQEEITDEDPYKVPMRIYPAIHYTMGGLWVDYNLMTTTPGLHVARRSELLGSRREPARRKCADAGAGRRLLRHSRTPSALPRLDPDAHGHDLARGVRARRPATSRRGSVGSCR